MKCKVWKWIYGISLALLVLLAVFTVGIWALGNATAAMAGAIMGQMDPDNFGYRYLSFGQFITDFIGSPMFFVCLAVFMAHIASVTALVFNRKPH